MQNAGFFDDTIADNPIQNPVALLTLF